MELGVYSFVTREQNRCGDGVDGWFDGSSVCALWRLHAGYYTTVISPPTHSISAGGLIFSHCCVDIGMETCRWIDHLLFVCFCACIGNLHVELPERTRDCSFQIFTLSNYFSILILSNIPTAQRLVAELCRIFLWVHQNKTNFTTILHNTSKPSA